MELTWGANTSSIGEPQNFARDQLIGYLSNYLRKMYRLGQWDAKASILCIQSLRYDEVESVRVEVEGMTYLPTNY